MERSFPGQCSRCKGRKPHPERLGESNWCGIGKNWCMNAVSRCGGPYIPKERSPGWGPKYPGLSLAEGD